MTSAAVREPVGLQATAPSRHIADAADLTRPPAPGAASLAVRYALDRPRTPARVIAVFPSAVYLELRSGVGFTASGRSTAPGEPLAGSSIASAADPSGEPDVLALVTADAVRLPNSIVVPGGPESAFEGVREGDDAWVGDAYVEITAPGPAGVSGGRRDSRCRLRVRVRRWWDPSPVLGPVSPRRLEEAAMALEETAREGLFGLAGHPGPVRLAERCAAGDLAYAIDAAERIVGLGPGLTPTGDDVLAGLLISLRTLGAAVPGGEAAVRLADWLGAAVTAHAGTRTTALAATLLRCAARGQAGVEVAAVLRGIAGLEPLRPAARRLLTAGHTSGTDLTWGVLAGCRATLTLAAAHAAEKAPG